MSENRMEATLTDDQRGRANTALATLAEVLPFLIDLGAKDRDDSPKFGTHRTFVVKALGLAKALSTYSRSVSISRSSAPTCDCLTASTP